MSKNVVPTQPGQSQNYLCSWTTQNFTITREMLGGAEPTAETFEGSDGARLARNNLTEAILFGPNGWASDYFQPVRPDCLLLLDDGWDVPQKAPGESWKMEEFGSLELDTKRFPSCTGQPQERLATLVRIARHHGWRGVGLWVAAHPARDPEKRLTHDQIEAYYRQRAQWCQHAGVTYWKVDWGDYWNDLTFYRPLLSRIGRDFGICIEHARCIGPINDPQTGRFSTQDAGKSLHDARTLLNHGDILRIYDCLLQFSTVTLLDRAVELCTWGYALESDLILNAEDHCTLAAACGFTVGIMRHPIVNPSPFQQWDPDKLYLQIDEVTRALRWQRIAPPFAAKIGRPYIDPHLLMDAWEFKRGETWHQEVVGKVVKQSAPAIFSRGIPLPHVQATGDVPFVVASRHPNGAVAVATLPRVLPERGIFTPLAEVTVDVQDATQPIGIFGRYQNLKLVFNSSPAARRWLAQDLAADHSVDLTTRLNMDHNSITLDGKLIEEIGLSAATVGDLSGPGLVLMAV